MSRVMEIITDDPHDLVSRRAYTAMRRIGKVLSYTPEQKVEGKVYIDGWPSLITVSWRLHRDGQRIRVDIAATSADELSRAADAAMYMFASEFKQIGEKDLLQPGKPSRKQIGWAIAMTALAAAAAHYFGWIPLGN